MSILIKNVQIVDGEGGEPYPADVLIQKNVISAIGDLKGKDADEVIDGLGDYLVPGFIDVDASSDQYLALITNPAQADFPKQGVTTIIGGHCGASLAPLLYGTLESIRKWVDITQVNVNWHTLEEFFGVVGKLPLGVNFGTLIGHATVRRSINGGAAGALTSSEMKVFLKILRKAMDEGAYGFSTGLGYAHGRLTPYAEIDELTSIIAEYGGVYSTHLRSETSGLIGSVEETIKIANEVGVRTVISHMRPLLGFEAQFDEAVSRIEKNSSPDNLRFYVYPFDTSLNPLYTLLPLWAQEKDFETMLSKIRNPETALRIENDMAGFPFERITFADVPKHEYLVGKTAQDLSAMFGVSPVKAIIKAMDVTSLRAMIFNKNINFEKLSGLLSDDRVLIASNAASRADSYKFLTHERVHSTFPRYLEIVLGHKLLTLPQAIKKITFSPAAYFGLKDRGTVKEGKIADLVILGKDDYRVRKTIVGGQYGRGEALRHAK
ncbi:MAG: hypothetical protein A3B23_00670 [Candidatus Colwellbacteria bacterium RIFCSPLOWO2_01_FULL_48_10]|uniref:Amidohydrolase 3 domain-containing protein n=1 Tax=Candidatus Colwellbacteria bacterium RIFCSPLOWO2_01_FULL_48_10 TaxID=1797690 RepID=A0A1G1Z5A6_9BACT|nr:MAG: hypothetical protein A3B23_00670 [Candidatus Colwellbacteria bacterium RIFCSPLOWO2_01_FULL_48_10]